MSRRERRAKRKLSLGSNEDFGSSPFDSLVTEGLPESASSSSSPAPERAPVDKKDGMGMGDRLEIRREKSGRGGKTVTTISGFRSRICRQARNGMLKEVKTKLGTGGTWDGDCMEIQGDKRQELVSWLSDLGFRPVLAGG
tara:strand:+ start:8118 stop:8537 length:420 start_codon:yes stop_codon:yes gene_type:complete